MIRVPTSLLLPRPFLEAPLPTSMAPRALPKNRPKPVPSNSRELVAVGPREVFKSRQHGRERDANGNKPLTARALVLRNGKHGAMGTGEVVLATRMSGREKLELLAGMWSCRPTRSAQEWFSDCREVAVCRGSHEASHRGTVQARRVSEDCRFAAQRYTSPITSRVCCASALSASIWQRTWMI